MTGLERALFPGHFRAYSMGPILPFCLYRVTVRFANGSVAHLILSVSFNRRVLKTSFGRVPSVALRRVIFRPGRNNLSRLSRLHFVLRLILYAQRFRRGLRVKRECRSFQFFPFRTMRFRRFSRGGRRLFLNGIPYLVRALRVVRVPFVMINDNGALCLHVAHNAPCLLGVISGHAK